MATETERIKRAMWQGWDTILGVVLGLGAAGFGAVGIVTSLARDWTGLGLLSLGLVAAWACWVHLSSTRWRPQALALALPMIVALALRGLDAWMVVLGAALWTPVLVRRAGARN